MVRHILLPVDNSDGCEEAVRWFMGELYKDGDQLHLMHVVPRLAWAAAVPAKAEEVVPQFVSDGTARG